MGRSHPDRVNVNLIAEEESMVISAVRAQGPEARLRVSADGHIVLTVGGTAVPLRFTPWEMKAFALVFEKGGEQ